MVDPMAAERPGKTRADVRITHFRFAVSLAIQPWTTRDFLTGEICRSDPAWIARTWTGITRMMMEEHDLEKLQYPCPDAAFAGLKP